VSYMGDISIIARRLRDGHVQYGWSGNGGYYKMLGSRILYWYDKGDDELIEYLFGLGQFRFLGKPGSEKGGEKWHETHALADIPHYLGTSEREIFSKIVFIDYGYFYDLDHKWYYIVPGPFRIKMPLALIDNNLDEDNFEFSFLIELQKSILHHMFYVYVREDKLFESTLEGMNIDEIYQELVSAKQPIEDFWRKYKKLFAYFDDWIVIRSDDEYRNVTDIILKKKSNSRVETIDW